MSEKRTGAWLRTTLGKLGRFSTSSVDKLVQPHERPAFLVNYMDVYRHRRIDSTLELQSVTATSDEHARFQVQKGDILFTPSSETPDDIGHSAVVFDDLTNTLHSYHTVRLRPDGKVPLDIGFSAYFANAESVRRYFSLRAAGSTRYTLSLDSFQHAKVDLPPFDQQQRIAEILETLDYAIEKTESLIAKAQQIKVGLMHDLFTRGVTPDGQLRPPREVAPELYCETVLGWVPREWEVSGLADKGRSGAQWIKTGPFGSSLKGEHWRDHGHPVITIGALGEGVFTSKELLFVGSKDATRLIDFQLKSGDVVFSRVADVGRSVVVRDEQAGWIMSSNLMRISVDASRVRPDFLQMTLAGDTRIKAQIRARVNSGGRDVANSAVLSQLRFAWPDADEQDRIIDRLNRVGEQLNAERQKVDNLRAQKLGLMHDLLTGKVVLTEAQQVKKPSSRAPLAKLPVSGI